MATVLLIGSGGREHAIAWKLALSPKVAKVLVSPGNGGTQSSSKISNVVAGSDNDSIANFAASNNVDLVVVGPEQPLVDGLVDVLTARKIKCFGPSKAAAKLEGSKAFSKEFMVRHGIPTATHASFSDYARAREYVQGLDYKVVIKASGLAAGKGVLLPETREEALVGLERIMVNKEFGEEACKEVVVEECLEGPEVSLLAFTDGTTCVSMPAAQDHKRALNGDKGLNTGGMGAYAPAPVFTAKLREEVQKNVIQATIDACKKDGIEYSGVLYAGLMLTPQGPKVLEYNCRFGDPETQVVLPLLESDLYEIMMACAEKQLNQLDIEWYNGAAATVVAASKGYPQSYPKGLAISGADEEPKSKVGEELVAVFHAGTKLDNGVLKTSGGRVLAVTARSSNIKNALGLSYNKLSTIKFDGMQYRTDIGWRALRSEHHLPKFNTQIIKDNSKLVTVAIGVGLVAGFLLGRMK